ncbi:MAG: endonuclease/exonuclease/phosphatase family protein [Chthoniobacterales bacterium]|nr:endonuclease/exonuclease/phosphatase family protein [Chthoniobacterales bacterium]
MNLRRAILAAALAFALPAMASDGNGRVVFTSWNLRNYRLQPLVAEGGQPAIPAKPASSIEAVVQTLVSISPDILGLCEVGSPRDLKHLQRSLQRAGLSLPHSTLVEGEDQHRRIALLSRFPLRQISHETLGTFRTGDVPHRVQRGFLDCVADVRPHFQLRILGAHLKSRRIVPDFDQAEVRRAESHLLRKRMEKILGEYADSPLLAFGDFNDTKNSPVIRGLLGRRGTRDAMNLVPLSDKLGDQWTYHWAEADEYSRIDFVMVSNSLRPHIDTRASRVHRSPDWRIASDHRPLVVTLNIPPNP